MEMLTHGKFIGIAWGGHLEHKGKSAALRIAQSRSVGRGNLLQFRLKKLINK